mmetsp:Transcript_34296/g.47737  ORF Transcript_34296/g.47737 Transcript_34296/m.47737 type:complete len:307 (-) Transcript_34296:449-1369(-)
MITTLFETITGIFLIKIKLNKKQTRFSIIQYLPFRNFFAAIEFCSLYNFFYYNERIIGFLKHCYKNIQPGSIIIVSNLIYNHLISLSHDNYFIADNISLKLTRLLREYFFNTLTNASNRIFETIVKFVNNSMNKIKFNSFKFYDTLIIKRNQKTMKDINDKFTEIVLIMRKNYHNLFDTNEKFLNFFENCRRFNHLYYTIRNKNFHITQYHLKHITKCLQFINENFKSFKIYLNCIKEKNQLSFIIIIFSLKTVLHFQLILSSIFSYLQSNEGGRPPTLKYYSDYHDENVLTQTLSISSFVKHLQE